jgi:diguanylate cyclase (GGDEF)-like protein
MRSAENPRILLLEDSVDDRTLIERALAKAIPGAALIATDNAADFHAALGTAPDVILADYDVPGSGARAVLETLAQRGLDIPVIVVTGAQGDERAAECIRLGAVDYLLKDRLSRLGSAIQGAIEGRRQARRIARLSRVQQVLGSISSVIVRVRDSQKLLEEACRIAVVHGAYRMAWIGMLKPGSTELALAARHGSEEGPLAAGEVPVIGDGPVGRHVAGRALAEGRTVVIDDIGEAHELGGAREHALRMNLRSAIAMPLLLEGKPVAAMVLYAAEAGVFDADEIRLLEGLAADISLALEFLANNERLAYLAYYDVLTGLPNRAQLLDRLGQELGVARGENRLVALALLDIERFKSINDALGRRAGDALLRQIAARLRDASPSLVFHARVGPDCFAVLMRGMKDASEIAHVLDHAVGPELAAVFRIEGRDLRLGARAGVAIFPYDGLDADALYHNAEAALKRGKATGERRVFYAPELNARVAEALTLENKLRKAIEAREFVLHYQPIYDLGGTNVTGVEALIRWNDPETGLVLPQRFIPVLEETGMILEVGRWALAQAVADRRSWVAAGLPAPRVSVNVSPLQLRQPGFAHEVSRVLADASGEVYGLDLEITESLIMEDLERNIPKLAALRSLGVNVTVDDFGTGYSSLSYLAKLPVNALKIDRSFIVEMTKGPEGMAIVSTIIGLAHSLRLAVVAEGVDTGEQARLLRLMRCDELQGFLFSPALPSGAFARLLAGGRRGLDLDQDGGAGRADNA